MNRLGAGPPGSVEDAVDAEVGLARGRRTDRDGLIGIEHVERGAVGLGVDSDRRITELTTGPDHADGDLAAIGDEDFHGRAL